MEIQQCALIIKERPFCYWDIDLKETNLRFINGIDPTYFQKMADIYFEKLGGKDYQVAAISLRASYFHGLETLFSLLCATIQAPYCVYGWLHHYDTSQLRSAVLSIQDNCEIQNALNLKEFTWLELSNIIHQSLSLEDKEKEARIKTLYGEFWEKLAEDFLDDNIRIEYNHIKHGFRVRSGGFHISIGEEKEPGVPAKPQDMKPMGGSKYGTSFYVPIEFQSEDKTLKKLHYQIEEHNINWDPLAIGFRVKLISESINNILSFLKIGNGVNPQDTQFIWPPDLTIFDDAWKVKGGVFKFKVKASIAEESVKLFSREELLNQYEKNAQTK